MKRHKLLINLCLSIFFLVPGGNLSAQVVMNIKDVIEIGQANSLNSMLARMNFMSQYWSYRSFKAELLPSVNLRGDLMEFNRSMVEARNYETGELSLVRNNTLSNNLSLSITQAIAPLGGTISVQSYLYRLDQFSYNSKLYNSQPVRLSYTQPLRAFNSLKWRKKTEPMKFQKAKRAYLEKMEDIAVQVVNLFFSVISAQSSFQKGMKTLEDRQQLYAIYEKRHDLGTVTKNELLQLKLSLLNAEMDKNNLEINLKNERFRLFSFLGIRDYENIELVAPAHIPDIVVNPADVIDKALDNSQHTLSQQLTIYDAEKTLKQAKASRGLQMNLHGEIGFNRTANHFADAYRNLESAEIVGLSFSFPIFDWGVGRGRVKMAEADLEATKTQMVLEREKYIDDLQTQAIRFNMQSQQCKHALMAKEIADERYEITKQRFEAGGITVTDLNTAQNELDHAADQYISELHSFWEIYYSLRRSTLFDWIMQSDITIDYDEIIQNNH